MSPSLFIENTLSCQVIKAAKTLREMFDDRGYIDNDLRLLGDDKCLSMVASRETLQIRVTDDTLLVMYMTMRHNGSTVRADLKKRIDPKVHRRCILVFRDVPSNCEAIAKKLKEDLSMTTLPFIEVFSLEELQFNVTKHHLVPKHERITSPAEIQSVLQKYGVRKNQLPIILAKTDPVCRYLGAEPGDLIKITRMSPTAGEHIIYRYCS